MRVNRRLQFVPGSAEPSIPFLHGVKVDLILKTCPQSRQSPMRYAITDQIWAVTGPMVERCKSHLGPPPEIPDRMFFEAVLYWARTAVPWRDLPDCFGRWS